METTDYCDYKLSLALKAAGFDELCRAHYTNDYVNDDPEDLSREVKFHYDWSSPYNYNRVVGNASAPTLWHAQKWLREKKGVVVTVGFEPIDDSDLVYTNTINRYNPEGGKNVWDCWDTYYSLNGSGNTYSGGWDSYEEALSAGIASALELIKKEE